MVATTHEDEHSNDKNDRQSLPPKITTTKTILSNLSVAAVYFIVARLSLLLAFQHTNATPVWPPTGIALAALLLLGYRVWPGILAGAFLANIFTLAGIGFSAPDSVVTALITASGNMLEALVGAALIHRFTGNSYPFDRVRDIFVFVVFGALLNTMISSTVGVTSLCLRLGDWTLYGRLWLTWWLGDATGAIVITPILLSWKRLNPSEWELRKIGEALLLCVLLCVVSGLVFVSNSPLKYTIVPILLWVVLRFGLFETSLSIALVSGLAVYVTVKSATPLTGKAVNESLLLLQSYIGAIAVSALFLSVVVKKHKRSEDALRTQIAFTDAIIDSVPGAFYVLDAQGRLVRWNQFLEEINELSPGELKDMNSLRNIHEEDRELISGKITEAFEKGQSEAEARICTKNGVHHFLFTGRRVDIERNIYVVGSGIDITKRKLAELKLADYQKNLENKVEERTTQLTEVNAALGSEIEERMEIEKTLSQSEAKYRDLVESANSVILRWTEEGNVTFINKFGQRFFGYPEDELIGQNIIGTIVPPADSAGRITFLVKDVFENPEAYALNENENITKDGKRVWVAWTNKPILNDEGNVIEILSVGNDITDRKLAENRLKQTLDELASAKERAEAADHLKSAFLATMSHELRTPLNSIIGFTGIILQGYVGALNDEQTKQLGMVRKSANHLLSLINDVLDISKIEAGQLEVSLDSFNLTTVIEQAVQSSRPAADKKGLSLSVSISPLTETIVSDQRRVEQILLNLLSNAIKFTEKGGVHIECKRDDESVTVSVTDTGMGIKEESMIKLFRAFQQVDTGTTRKYEGTGLGLYIVKGWWSC